MGYLDNTGLQRFFTGLKSIFAPISHTHDAEDITDYPNDSTKYLRGDGSWAVPPSGSDTTYTFATGSTDGTISVTPSDTQTAQEVAVAGLGSAAFTQASDYAYSGHSHSGASTSSSGFMSASDKTKLDAVGTFYSGSGSPSLSSGSTATMCSIANLPAGVYVVEATCRFNSNTTGRRALRISTSSSEAAESGNNHVSIMATANGYVACNTIGVFSFSSTTTLYARAYQNAGAALNTSCYMYAVRIK